MPRRCCQRHDSGVVLEGVAPSADGPAQAASEGRHEDGVHERVGERVTHGHQYADQLHGCAEVVAGHADIAQTEVDRVVADSRREDDRHRDGALGDADGGLREGLRLDGRRDRLAVVPQLQDGAAVEQEERHHRHDVGDEQPVDGEPVVERLGEIGRQRDAEDALSVREGDETDRRSRTKEAGDVHYGDGDLEAARRQRFVFDREANGKEAVYSDEDEVPHGQHHGTPVDVLTMPDIANSIVDGILADVPDRSLHEDAASERAHGGVNQGLMLQENHGQAGEGSTVDG